MTDTVDVMKDDNSIQPVQGILFSDTDIDSDVHAYRGTVASKIAGITYRQLDYWARKNIVEPSLHTAGGSGSRRLYSFKDIVILAISKRLLDAGVNLQNVNISIGGLQRHKVDDFVKITMLSDGQNVYECTTDSQIMSLMHSGKALFGLSVKSVFEEIKENLSHEQYIDLSTQTISGKTGRVIDELAARRLRKKIELRKKVRAQA